MLLCGAMPYTLYIYVIINKQLWIFLSRCLYFTSLHGSPVTLVLSFSSLAPSRARLETRLLWGVYDTINRSLTSQNLPHPQSNQPCA